MSAHDAAILRMLAQMDARQARIEFMLAQLVAPAEPAINPVPMIADLTGGDWFTASELWQSVQALRLAAEAVGEPAHDVVQAFADLGIFSVKSLGKWLAARPDESIERTERTRAGVLWRIV